MHLPRRVVLVVDRIVQENRIEIILYNDKRDRDVEVQDKRQRLYEWIEIKKRCSPSVSLRMVGVKVVRKRNT